MPSDEGARRSPRARRRRSVRPGAPERRRRDPHRHVLGTQPREPIEATDCSISSRSNAKLAPVPILQHRTGTVGSRCSPGEIVDVWLDTRGPPHSLIEVPLERRVELRRRYEACDATGIPIATEPRATPSSHKGSTSTSSSVKATWPKAASSRPRLRARDSPGRGSTT